MKRIAMLMVVGVLMCGCVGGPMIGPLTTLNGIRNRRVLNERRTVALARAKNRRTQELSRAVLESKAPAEKQELAMKLVNLGADSQQVQVGAGIVIPLGRRENKPELVEVRMTTGERVWHGILCVLDIVIDGVLIDQGPVWVDDLTGGDGDLTDEGTITIYVNGANHGSIGVINGDNNTENDSTSGSGTEQHNNSW